jgi:hypothetical protein
LFEILNKNINIEKYAEYNSPFMGLFLNFFYNEYKKGGYFFYKEIHKSIINYLTSRQLAGKSRRIKELSKIKSIKYVNQIHKLKIKNKKKKVEKFLFIDNSSLKWGINDNYKSVNSKSYAQEMLDLELLEVNKYNKKYKFDLFGIFHSLDHTFEPSVILNFALNFSKYVVVYSHNQIDDVSQQHLFSLTKNFVNYLKKKKIFSIDITDRINKNYKSPEIYFICSKNKKNINTLKKKLI